MWCMKFLFLVLLATFSLNAQTDKIIVVDNADQFVDAIGSDRTIQLQGSTIYLSNVSPTKTGSNYRFDNTNEGYELVIFGVKNLKIQGLTSKPVKIITKPTNGNVIVFNNSDNLSIENVNAGHGPNKGDCEGGVFYFTNCNNISINKSILYGSGMEGISAENVTNLKCNNSSIRSCTYAIMSLDKCNEVEFNNCEFSDNKEYDLVTLSNCIGIKFLSCTFSNNSTLAGEESEYALFNVTQSMAVILKDCLIESNSTSYFCNKANIIDMSNCKLENNSFVNGLYKE